MKAARLLAVLLPLGGLAALWAESDRTFNSGTEWEVPIMGYDPRDFLRGHYVEFSYDWPGLDDENIAMQPDTLCLQGKAPNLEKVFTAGGPSACIHPITIGADVVYGTGALRTGRLYLGQERAAQLEEELRNRDQRGIVTIRQREDGSFTPISIRFRPLTPAEIAEREAPPEAPLSPFDPLAPPAVMDK